MRSALPFLALVLASGPAFGQEQPAEPGKDQDARSFRLTRFEFEERFSAFEIAGMAAGLPANARLNGRILLNGTQAAAFPLYVREGAFDAQVKVEGRTVLPGTYVLEVTARRQGQRGEALTAWPEGLDEDVGSTHHSYMPNAEASTEAGVREDVIRRAQTIRANFDLACQIGYGTLRRIDQAGEGIALQDPAAREKLLAAWSTFVRDSEHPLVAGLESFRKENLDGVFISPLKPLVEVVVGLYQTVIGLRSSYSVAILTKLGMEDRIPPIDLERGRFSVENLIAQIYDGARAMEQRIGAGRPVWAPVIQIPKERGSVDGKGYVSSTSKFRIEVPNERWQVEMGEADSTMRVCFRLMHRDIPMGLAMVHMVEFPGAETADERIEAWKRLAEYDWPKYRFISGAWVDDEKGNHLYYLFRFKSRSDAVGRAHVTCYLHVPQGDERKGLLYGVMVVSFMEGLLGEVCEEDLKKTAESFQLDR